MSPSNLTVMIPALLVEHPAVDDARYPATDLRGCARSRALFLIKGYYTVKYGVEIRSLTPPQCRDRINNLVAERTASKDKSIRRGLRLAIADFERICALHEILR